MHILDACEAINNYVGGFDKNEFISNQMRRDAIVRQLQIIGEAVKNISLQTRERHPQIIWREIAGMRDRITHKYFEVDLEIVWIAATQDVPKLKAELVKVLEDVRQIEQEENQKK